MAMATTFIAGLFALVIWIPAKSYGVLIFYAIIGGTCAGTFWVSCAYTLSIIAVLTSSSVP